MRIQRSSDRTHRQLKSQKTGEKYSLSNVLSEDLLTKDIFISQEIIPPDSRSSAPHFHQEIDEIIYILKGMVIAVEGHTGVELSEGDAICFEANSNQHHYLKNVSHEDAVVLVIRGDSKKQDVVFPVKSSADAIG